MREFSSGDILTLVPVSALREITIGVSNLEARVEQFREGCRLDVLSQGAIAPLTATRLFDLSGAPSVAILGRKDIGDAPRLRLVSAGAVPPSRTSGLKTPGPVGVGFTTLGIGGVHARLAGLGVSFLSPPTLLTPIGVTAEGAPPGPRRFEAFGRAEDGDFIVLIERMNAATPYGTFGSDCSEPLHASFVVTNLEATVHFMKDVLEHEILISETCAGPPFDALLGLDEDVSFRFAMPHHPAHATGRTVFLEFEKKLEPMAPTPSLSRGICRLRYETTDLHQTLARVPGGGGSLVKGPSSIDDPVLGSALVALVRSPFGVVIELWERG